MISTGAPVANTVTTSIGDGLLDVEIYDKIAGTWALGKTWSFFETIGKIDLSPFVIQH